MGGYAFCHDAYNGPPDPRCGHGATVAEVVDQIDEIEGEPVAVNLLEEALARGMAPSQQS